jgi:hypothetical protein
MTWQTFISPGPVWTGVELYADERIAALTLICTDPESTDVLIRQAQAGIAELKRLKNLPGQQKATSDQKRSSGGNRHGSY